MDPNNRLQNKQIKSPSHTQIARIVFNAAESMGISDRRLIERLTTRVIDRFEKQPLPGEQPPTLPGMEDLIAKPRRQKRLPTSTEIQALIEEIMAAEELKHKEEAAPKMKTIVSKSQPTAGIKLTENALHVLQRRYLKSFKMLKLMLKRKGWM